MYQHTAAGYLEKLVQDQSLITANVGVVNSFVKLTGGDGKAGSGKVMHEIKVNSTGSFKKL